MPTNIKIRWMGRSGNNLLQAINAIEYCRRGQHHLVSDARPPLLPGLDIDFSEGTADGSRGERLFYERDCHFALTTDQKRSIALEYYDRFALAPARVPPDALVIHLRAGDIMDPSVRKSRMQVQPPLAFYRRLLKDYAFREVLVITEPDGSNPVTPYLIDEFGVTLVPGDLSVHYGMMLGAAHFCPALSTLSYTAGIFSKTVKRLYLPVPGRPTKEPVAYDCFGALSYCEAVRYVVGDYTAPGTWTGSDAQRELMITLPNDKVRKL